MHLSTIGMIQNQLSWPTNSGLVRNCDCSLLPQAEHTKYFQIFFEPIQSQEFVDRASDSITQLRLLFKSELENELEGL